VHLPVEHGRGATDPVRQSHCCAQCRVERYGLDKAGVAITERKAIGIGDDMRTNVGHISPSATSPAYCSWRMWPRPPGGKVSAPLTFRPRPHLAMLPRATFCQRDAASFGLTEEWN
jgi:dihydrolipoamide dehydrogenase